MMTSDLFLDSLYSLQQWSLESEHGRVFYPIEVQIFKTTVVMHGSNLEWDKLFIETTYSPSNEVNANCFHLSGNGNEFGPLVMGPNLCLAFQFQKRLDVEFFDGFVGCHSAIVGPVCPEKHTLKGEGTSRLTSWQSRHGGDHIRPVVMFPRHNDFVQIQKCHVFGLEHISVQAVVKHHNLCVIVRPSVHS